MSGKVQYLYCKPGGCYYFRRNIPLTLKSYFPKATTEIRKSLKTKCLKTAKVNIKVWSYRVEKLFTLMRSGMLTHDQLNKIAQDFFHDFLAKDLAYRNDLSFESDYIWDEDGSEQLFSGTSENIDTLLTDIRKGKHLEQHLKPFLKEQGITIDNEAEYQRLTKLVNINLKEAYKIIIAREYEDYDNPYDKRTEKLHQSSPINTQPQPEENKGALLSEVIEKYIEDKELSKSWTPKTKQEVIASFNLFIKILSDKPIKAYGREDFVKFRRTLVLLPLVVIL